MHCPIHGRQNIHIHDERKKPCCCVGVTKAFWCLEHNIISDREVLGMGDGPFYHIKCKRIVLPLPVLCMKELVPD